MEIPKLVAIACAGCGRPTKTPTYVGAHAPKPYCAVCRDPALFEAMSRTLGEPLPLGRRHCRICRVPVQEPALFCGALCRGRSRSAGRFIIFERDHYTCAVCNQQKDPKALCLRRLRMVGAGQWQVVNVVTACTVCETSDEPSDFITPMDLHERNAKALLPDELDIYRMGTRPIPNPRVKRTQRLYRVRFEPIRPTPRGGGLERRCQGKCSRLRPVRHFKSATNKLCYECLGGQPYWTKRKRSPSPVKAFKAALRDAEMPETAARTVATDDGLSVAVMGRQNSTALALVRECAAKTGYVEDVEMSPVEARNGVVLNFKRKGGAP